MATDEATTSLPALDVDAFRRAYRGAVDDVLPFLTDERLDVIAHHNPGWRPGAYDHRDYLRSSELRYVTALETFAGCGGGASGGRLTVLDAGGFMGAFPLALARTGARVTLSEKYGYYYGAFDELRDYLVAEGVEVWDADLTAPLDPLPEARFDLVTNMAVLEHLAHSPKALMENLGDLLAPAGRAILEVPNMAYWPRRLSLAAGRSPLAPLADVWHAAEPFTGHHREYTAAELRLVVDWSGLELDRLVFYDYSRLPDARLRALDRVLCRFPTMRELLLACASRRPSSRGRGQSAR